MRRHEAETQKKGHRRSLSSHGSRIIWWFLLERSLVHALKSDKPVSKSETEITFPDLSVFMKKDRTCLKWVLWSGGSWAAFCDKAFTEGETIKYKQFCHKKTKRDKQKWSFVTVMTFTVPKTQIVSIATDPRFLGGNLCIYLFMKGVSSVSALLFLWTLPLT